jgi:hypothetical protein
MVNEKSVYEAVCRKITLANMGIPREIISVRELE